MSRRADEVAIVPLTPRRWPAFEELFGPRGACGGCWCMTPRLARRDYEAAKGAKNRAAMQRLVACGPPPGLIALRGGAALGWIAVAPRAELLRLAASRVLAPVDAAPVWSIACLFVRKDARRAGLSSRLIRAAAEFAFARGATIVLPAGDAMLYRSFRNVARVECVPASELNALHVLRRKALVFVGDALTAVEQRLANAAKGSA